MRGKPGLKKRAGRNLYSTLRSLKRLDAAESITRGQHG
jgi:hypothetical protein